MKKRKLGIAIIICIFIVFNVIALTMSIEHTNSFWTAYAFTNGAILVQIFIWKKAFESEKSSKSKILGIPIANVGCIYAITQLIVFLIVTSSSLGFSQTSIICAATIGVFSVLLLSGESSKQETKKIIESTKAGLSFIEESRKKLELMIADESDEAKTKMLTSLLDEFRYSDPRSDEVLSSIETIIAGKIEELKYSDDYSKLIGEISNKLKQRNIICKNNK